VEALGAYCRFESALDPRIRELSLLIAARCFGEFRRRDFRTGFVEAVDGLQMRSWDMPWHTSEGVTKLRSHTGLVTGRLRQRERPACG
jgi:hypothetical protein